MDTQKPNENSPTTGLPAHSDATVALGGAGSTFGAAFDHVRSIPENFPEIPGFKITRELGRGAMGVVYQATQTNLDRPVAIKLLLTGSESLYKRFELEANALGRIHNDGIMRIYDVGAKGNQPYLVMELLEGGTLTKATAGLQTDPNDAAKLILQMARGLDAIHSAGLLHRDLKPGNVMLVDPPPKPDANGHIRLGGIRVKLCDFGLAKDISDESDLTQTGVVMGTPGYMAPEQAMGQHKNLTPATDIHALGAILYELLTGQPPFRGESPLETIRMAVDKDPVAPRKLRAGIPIDLETICLKCLQKHPVRRYQTATELADDLGAFLSNNPIRARRASWVERGWKWCMRNPAGAASIGFISAGVLIATMLGFLAMEYRMRQNARSMGQLQETVGFERLQANDLTKAAVWFAAALGHESDKTRIELERLRLGAIIDGFAWIRSYVVHNQAVRGAEWSPSGKLYMTFGDDCSVRVHDPAQFPPTIAQWTPGAESIASGGIRNALFYIADNKEKLLILDGSGRLFDWNFKDRLDPEYIGGGFDAITLAPAGRQIALARGNRARVFDLESGAGSTRAAWLDTKDWTEIAEEVRELAFAGSPGRVIVRTDHSLSIFDAAKPTVATTLAGLGGVVTCMAKTPDGNHVAAGNDRGDIRIWDTKSGLVHNVTFGHPEKILCLAFSPNGKLLASGSTDQRVSVRDWNTGHLKYQVGHDGDVTCLAFSQNPQWLLTGSEDNTIRIWHSESGRPASSQLVYNATLRTIVPHPTEPLLLAGGDDNVCCLWDTIPKNRVIIRTGLPMDQFLVNRKGLLAMRFGESVRVGSTLPISEAFKKTPATGWDRTIDFDAPGFLDSLRTLPVKGKSIALMGNKVAMLDAEGSVFIWDMENQELKTILPPDPMRSKATAIIGDKPGSHFVLETQGVGGRKIELFQADGRPIPIPETEAVSAWAFGNNDILLGWGDARGDLRVAYLGSDPPRIVGPTRAHAGGVTSIAIGSVIATGGEDMRVRLWNSDLGKPLFPDAPVPRHASSVSTISFLDDTHFLSGGEDNTMRYWDTKTGNPLPDTMLHNSSVTGSNGIILPELGRELASSSSSEGAVYIWDLQSGQIIAPLMVLPGYTIRGFDFLENAGPKPVVIAGGSMGTIMVQRVVEPPKEISAGDLLNFAEYHPAFKINNEGTKLNPIPGPEMAGRMKDVWPIFHTLFPPLSGPFGGVRPKARDSGLPFVSSFTPPRENPK